MSTQGSGGLLRVLGPMFGLAVGIGGMIGGGILRTPGGVLQHVPVAWLALALWAVAGVHTLLGANVVSELMTAVPKSGGLFQVARRAFGSYGALLVGWTDWLQTFAGTAALAVATAEFASMLVPALRGHIATAGFVIALAIFALNWAGVRQGGAAQIATTAAKTALLVLVAVAVFLAPPIRPDAQAAATLAGSTGIVGLVVAYQLIIGAYSGWVIPGYFAEEDVDPSRNIPRTMIGSVIAVTALYLLMNAALLHALPLVAIGKSELPAAAAVGGVLGGKGMALIAGVAIVTVVGCINANVMVGTRILHGLAQEGFLPNWIARVNRGGTPDVALGLTAACTAALTLTGQFELVFLAMGALSIATTAIIDVAYFRLRWAEPRLHRPYRAIGHPVAPALVLVLDTGVLAAFLAADLRSAAFMAAGVAACFPLARLARRGRPRATAEAGA